MFIDNKFDDPSIIKTTPHVDFNDKNLDNVRFDKVNSMPEVGEHSTAKKYVENASSYKKNEISVLRQDLNEQLELNEQGSIVLNSNLISPKTIIDSPIKSDVCSFYEGNGKRCDLSSVFNDQDNEFDNIKLATLDGLSVKRNPSSDNELSNKISVDDSIGKGTIVRFNQTLEIYLIAFIGDDTLNLTEIGMIQIIDTTFIKQGICQYLLPRWKVTCNDRNDNVVTTNFIRATETFF